MDIENTLVMYGGAIKALGEAEDGGRPVGKLGGVLCRFSSADDPDRTPDRDFFDCETDFKLADGMTTPVYYHHGLHAGVGVKEIGQGVLRMGPEGIGIECGLWLDDADAARYYREAQDGRLAWSSGTAAHLVKRTPVVARRGGISHHIDFWPLGLDASLTPHAAEPRNVAVALKSLVGSRQGEVGSRQRQEAVTKAGGEVGWSCTVGCDRLGEDGLKSLEMLEAGQLEGSRLVDHTARLHDAIAEYGERIGDICLNRATKAGPVFGAERHAMLCALLGQMRDAADDLGELLQQGELGSRQRQEAVAGKALFGADANAEDEELEGRLLGQQVWVQGLELDGLLLSGTYG